MFGTETYARHLYTMTLYQVCSQGAGLEHGFRALRQFVYLLSSRRTDRC